MLNGRWFAGRMVLVEYLSPKVCVYSWSGRDCLVLRGTIFFQARVCVLYARSVKYAKLARLPEMSLLWCGRENHGSFVERSSMVGMNDDDEGIEILVGT